jgi:hypothetical protein
VDAPERQPAVARFVPDRRYTGLAAAGAVAAVLAAVFTPDPPGRLLFALAALVLTAYVVSDLVFSPRLTASRDGLRIRSPMLRTELPWSAVEDVRADVRTRYGLRSTTLEVDAGETFAVFSRRSLGAEPEHAADLVRAFRPSGPT